MTTAKEINRVVIELKLGLECCTPAQKHMFCRMYASSANLPIDSSVEDVIDNMSIEKLKRALQQVNATLAKQMEKS